MKNLSNILKLIPQSVYDKFNKVSSVRIQALLTFGIIAVFALVFLGIEIATMITALIAAKTYVISSQILVVFASLLGHHLGLLFNKRKEYNKDETIDTTPAVSSNPILNDIQKDNKEVKSEVKEQELG